MSSMAKINWGVVLGLLVCYIIAFSLAIAAEQHRSKVQNSNTNLSCRLMKEDTIFLNIQIYSFQYYNGIHNSNIDIVCLFVWFLGYIIAHWNIIAFVQWFDFLLPVKLSCLFRGCLKHSWGWKTKWDIYHSTSASSTLIINIFRNVEIFQKKFFFQ
jgi:hypothetical protein